MFSLDKYNGSCNSLQDSSSTIHVSNKAEDLNWNVFIMITGINESKALIKHISYNCICKFGGRTCNSDQYKCNNKCQCKCKKQMKYRVSKNYYA